MTLEEYISKSGLTIEEVEAEAAKLREKMKKEEQEKKEKAVAEVRERAAAALTDYLMAVNEGDLKDKDTMRALVDSALREIERSLKVEAKVVKKRYKNWDEFFNDFNKF